MVASSSCQAEDGMAILQLRRWDQSQVQLNLSEFREAFISPTRELLLLLSYQCEALFLPLIAGEARSYMSMDSNDSDRCNSEDLQKQSSIPFYSSQWTTSSRSDSLYENPYPSEPVNIVSNSHFSHESSSSTSKNYPFVSDVKSLAWGHCGDAYNQADQHKDAAFKELLFVSGDHGVTVHAFRCREKNVEMVKSASEGETARGRWVEWGPFTASSHDVQEEVQLSSYHESSKNHMEVNSIDEPEECQQEVPGESWNSESSNSSSMPKRWLRTFLTEVETVESDGKFMATFPAKSSFPCSAEIVSFNLFDSTSIFWSFLSHANSVSYKNENQREETILKPVGDSFVNTESSLLNQTVNSDSSFKSSIPGTDNYGFNGMENQYKCSRVFSSPSHRLIGLVLTLADSVSNDISKELLTSMSKILVVVAMVHQWGIQWVCSVKLQDSHLSPGMEVIWTDFQFSDNFLVGLNSSGLIHIWVASSGKFVVRLDVLQSCGLNLNQNPGVKQSEFSIEGGLLSKSADVRSERSQGSKVHDNTASNVEGCFCIKRKFKKLMVTSNSSLLAAVDEYGIVYVVCVHDYISDNYFSVKKFIPQFQQCGLGILVGWEVAGSGIGCQRVLSDISNGEGLNGSSIANESCSFTDHSAGITLQKDKKILIQKRGCRSDSYLIGFSVPKLRSWGKPPSEISSIPMRRIFFPLDGCNKEDYIYFSPLGITRLVKWCSKKDRKGFKIVHTCLRVTSSILDDSALNTCFPSRRLSLFKKEEAFVGEAIGCSFQGCFYLVSKEGLSVVLPSISISSGILPIKFAGYWRPSSTESGYQVKNLLDIKEHTEFWEPWKIEVLDRAILYDGPEEADRICLENGWDLKVARMRRLQLALDYVKSDEIEQSLEMLVDVNMAEDGILRLLFTAVYQIFRKLGSDNEVAMASRFLALAACFATKMVRRYGLLEHKKDRVIFKDMYEVSRTSYDTYLESMLPMGKLIETGNSRRLQEMAHLLEIIRNLQRRLSEKCRRPIQGMVDGRDALIPVDTNVLQDDSPPILPMDIVSSGISEALVVRKQRELSFPTSDLAFDGTNQLSLLPMGSLISSTHLDEFYLHALQGGDQGRNVIPFENPKDMMTRWKIDNLDLKTVVKDALRSGRLPLAVLQLHLQRLRDLVTEKEPHDTFNEVRDVGRAIAYDLFLKGEIELAVATLQRLGEDTEISLRQLVFGTVRRSVRTKIADEMKRRGYLGPYECIILEKISLIERLYPSSSFWGSFLDRQKQFSNSDLTLPEEKKLSLRCSLASNNCIIECGEIDGVVIGSWTNVDESTGFRVVDEDNIHGGYWAAAASWSDAWDQRTMDRIVLDQPLFMGVHVPWESQLEYHICHNDWDEVSKVLGIIPASSLLDGGLQINMNDLRSVENGSNGKFPDYLKYICSAEDLDAVCINVPNIKIFKFPADNMCSMWLRMLMEQELAKTFIFMKEYWEGTAEIIPLLARAGYIFNTTKYTIPADLTEGSLDLNFSNISEEFHKDTVQALHKLVIHHCAQHNLPNLLDLYLDHHKLVLDNDSLGLLQESAGECQWAKWLLLSRIKGREYDASFSNARSVISQNVALGGKVSVLEVNEIIRTVDDIAEGGEMVALATLMYAPAPIQKSLCSGSVNRHCSSSAQCTLENLRPALQHFPTLWKTFVAACFGQDPNGISLGPNARSVFGNSVLSDYLNWRDSIFSSAGGDTSLAQMLPCWFPKPIRRLIQLYVQGPLGWQSLACGLPSVESFLPRDIDFVINANENAKASVVSLEAAIQKNIEEELYSSSFEEKGFGVEHHLHRGRALAAFNHLLGVRTLKFKSLSTSGASMHGQIKIQSDVQTLLSPLGQDEESLLSSVMPLAIVHFEDSVLVSSCAFLLEICGLSASMLRVDVAALQRISAYYKSIEYNEHQKNFAPKGSAFHAVTTNDGDFTASLARALADDYLHNNDIDFTEQEGAPRRDAATRRPSRALMAVLQHLEKASLPLMVEGNTCGSWLLSGSGDGIELRSQQKAASEQWNLVIDFCQLHHISLSTKYLSVLAKDNDWVGFLTEAQVVGYPSDVIIQVASKDFRDPRLNIHIVTVLRSMQAMRKKASSSTNSTHVGKSNEIPFSTEDNVMIPVELFGLIAECEKQPNPGQALMLRAKDLRWSLLAMIASCFPDVSPLSCLTVWLEITAARETSSIKVNDIASQIANNVGAAVEATNKLPTVSRVLTVRYNRRNPKRRHLMEPTSEQSPDDTPFGISSTPSALKMSVAQEISADEERKKQALEQIKVLSDPDEGLVSLSKMVAVLCEQQLFLPLLRAFEMFLPSCSLLPFIRALQAFSQMRLSEATAHLASFSVRIKEEPHHMVTQVARDEQIASAWISSTAVKAADAMLSTCPSAYERRCLLQLLAAADFGDGGSAASSFRRQYWKINLAEPSLRKGDDLFLGNETLDDASLLMALEKNGQWEQARNWASQLEASGAPWKSAVHHVTETQAEAMVAEWKEFLWDVPEEREALWGHCQTLFLRNSFPSLQAGLFFLKHAEAVEKDIPPRELHEILLLSLQWLSGTITQSNPVYPLHLLREIETRVWLLAVESEAQLKTDLVGGNSTSIIEQTASIITRMDNHLNAVRARATERNNMKENNQTLLRHQQAMDANSPVTAGGSIKMKRRTKSYMPSKRSLMDAGDKNSDPDDTPSSLNLRNSIELSRSLQLQEENVRIEESVSRWEERVGPAELERAVLSLLEFGQITAAKQLQQKLSPAHVPSEFVLVDVALKLAAFSSPSSSEISVSLLDPDALLLIQSYNIPSDNYLTAPLQVLEALATKCTEGSGRGLCKRIISVVKAANILGLSFYEAFEKRPIELLQLLSLKAQDSLEEAKLLVLTHSMPPANIARILAESFLKGLLAAHRGGYMDSQKEEGPAPLLWRFSDFLKWAELCPSEPEIGHALMRLVITGQEIPHACEVELLILSHHFYKSSACLDGVDVLVALAATRVDSYVSEGDFSCLARLVTGVSNFHALNFILDIIIENGQLELLLQKYSAAETTTGTGEVNRGFRMAVLTSLKHFNPYDLDAFAKVYNHFDMKHEMASLIESRAIHSTEQWLLRYHRDDNEDLLDSMRYYIEAAEVRSTIDAGEKTRYACAQASLQSMQIRMPDLNWLNLSETNARRALVEQSRFQEALIVAEAYGLNQPSEWALVLWNQMLKPDLTERFVAEFVSVLPLQPSMLTELARFYRAEVMARGDQSHFSVWLSPGGLPAEWVKHLGRSFRSLLKRTRDLRLRVTLATTATGFDDVIRACNQVLDKVPDTAPPPVLRKGHGGAYLPLM